MTRILLIPAAQTDWHDQFRLAGDMDLPLNDAGVRLAESVAAAVAPAAPEVIHCGNDEPARQTARIIGGRLQRKVKPHKAFREIDLGVWEGLTLDEFKERFAKVHRQWRADPLTIEPPEGESVPALTNRLLSGLARIVKKRAKAETIALVIGRYAWASLVCRIVDGHYGSFWDFIDEEPAWREIETSADELKARRSGGPPAQ